MSISTQELLTILKATEHENRSETFYTVSYAEIGLSGLSLGISQLDIGSSNEFAHSCFKEVLEKSLVQKVISVSEHDYFLKYIGVKNPHNSDKFGGNFWGDKKKLQDIFESTIGVKSIINSYDEAYVSDRLSPLVNTFLNEVEAKWGSLGVLDPQDIDYPLAISAITALANRWGKLTATTKEFVENYPKEIDDIKGYYIKTLDLNNFPNNWHVIEMASHNYTGWMVENSQFNQSTINGYVTAEHTQFSDELVACFPEEEIVMSCQIHLETSGNTGNLTVTRSNVATTTNQNGGTNGTSSGIIERLIDSIIDALTPKEASAAELNMSYAGELDKLNIIVEDDTGISETRTVSMEFGYIRIDEEPIFTLDNFHFDVDRFINNGDDPLVSYDISHNGNEDIRGVKLKFYATKNGELDGDEIYLEYESASTLSKGEINNESQAFDTLTELPGDWIIVTTVEYEGGGDPVVLRTDTVSIPAAQEIPEMQSVRLRNDDAVNDDGDLRIDYVLENSTDKDMRGFEVKFYASKTNSFNESTAIYLDRESAGTLRSGERDSEGETIRSAADLDAGDWNLFSVAYWDGQDEGMVLSTNQFTVEANTADIDLAVEDFRADDHVLDVGQDLKVRQTSINYGSDDARSTKTTYFWSEDKHFNIRDDIKIDTDTHGTLRGGEHDTNEYERIDYEDLPKGLGYVFALIDADHEFDEGLANETNNLSDALTIYVA